MEKIKEKVPELKPSELARFFELHECPHYIKLLYEKKKGSLDKYHAVLKVKSRIDDVLEAWGANFEELLLEETQIHLPNASFHGIFSEKRVLENEPPSLGFFIDNYEEGLHIVSSTQECLKLTMDLLRNLPRDRPTVIYQPCLRGTIGAFPVSGKADLIIAIPVNESFVFYVLEAKFSKEEKLFHRFQAVIYAYLLDQMLKELGINGKIRFGVITKGKRLEKWPPEGTMEYPTDAAEYVLTLEDKLGEDGPFYRMLNEESADLWLTMRCAECPFEPVCMAKAVERKDLGLLGIQPSYQRVFKEAGIHDIDDLAELYKFPTSSPIDFRTPKVTRPGAVSYIMGKTELGNLPKLSKMAHVLKKEIGRRTGEWVWPEFIPETGYNLPSEDGYYYPAGSLVRVYLFVQHSPIHDSLLGISAVVENTSTKKLRVISRVVTKLPETEDEAHLYEEILLDKFFKELFAAIRKVAPNLEGKQWHHEDSERMVTNVCTKDDVFLHLYFYSRFHRDKLMDAVKRHKTLYGMVAIRSLLSLRKAIDQEGYTILKDELIKRHALRFPPGFGIIHVVHQFRLQEGESTEEYLGNAPKCSWKGWFNWGGLERKFENLFSSVVKKENGKLVLAPEDGTSPFYNIGMSSFGGFKRRDGSEVPTLYPVIHREDEQIPLYIIWDALSKNKRDDLEKLLKYFVLAVRHIERSVPDRYKDKYVKKEPLNRKSLENFDIEDLTLAEVLEEYQKLEYFSRKEELMVTYRLPPSARTMTGKSAVIKVSKVDTDSGKGIIQGKLLLPPAEESGTWKEYDPSEAPLFNLDESSWVVVTPLRNECENSGCIRLRMPWERGDPAWKIARSPLAILQDFNRDSGEVTLTFVPITGRGPFLLNHTTPKLNQDWVKIGDTTISEGSYLILDPSMDDLNMNRAYNLLEEIINGRVHPVYSVLNRIYSSTTLDASSIQDYKRNIWNETHIKEFLRALKIISGDTSKVHTPNEDQRKFILDIDHFLVTLQGPPGSGKTSGAIAPAILARAYAAIKAKKNSLFVVTGVSHRAINEALTRTAHLKQSLSPHIDEMSKIEIYRLASSRDTLPALEKMLEEENFFPKTEGVTLESADNPRTILPITGQKTLFEAQSRVRVVFATPGAIYKLFRRAHPRADLLIIDEASMMDLPMFFLSTMSAKLKSEVLVVGDHRQTQPIQAHNWETEDRKTIEENVPFLSAINFVRFLRGEIDPEEQKEFENLLYRNPPLWESDNVKDEVLPVHKLKDTYRLLLVIANMLTKLSYKKDGIELRSKKQPAKTEVFRGIQAKKEVPKWIRWVLDPDYPCIVIEHFDTSSTKVNELEAQVVSEIVKYLPSELEVGVVVPYRAHKALIYDKLKGLKQDVIVDTVERFQGAEKDVIIVSMASSDPTYLSQVFNFIYDQNRFNVAASRAKEKLIFVAARSFFTTSAFDLEQFERAKVWKRLYLVLRNNGEALPPELSPDKIPLRGYRLNSWNDAD